MTAMLSVSLGPEVSLSRPHPSMDHSSFLKICQTRCLELGSTGPSHASTLWQQSDCGPITYPDPSQTLGFPSVGSASWGLGGLGEERDAVWDTEGL